MQTYKYISNLIKINNRDSLLECIHFVQNKTFIHDFNLLAQDEKELLLITIFNKFAYTYVSHYEKSFQFLNEIKNISENTSHELFNFWLNHTQKNKHEKTLDFLLDLDIQIKAEWTSNLSLYNKEELSIQYDNLDSAMAFFKIYAKNPTLFYHDYHNMVELIVSVSHFYKNNQNTFYLLQSTCHTEWAKKNNNPMISQPPNIEKIRFLALDEECINYFNDLEHKKGYHQTMGHLFEQNQDIFYRKKMYSLIQTLLKDNNTHKFVHFIMEHTHYDLMQKTLNKYPSLKKDEKIFLYFEKDRLEQALNNQTKIQIKNKKI